MSYGDLHNHGDVIRDPNVAAGHENNPTANAGANAHGWLRTGNRGVTDDQEYVRLTGRLKEIVNRGGEKTSRREVDGVPMDHSTVAQVVTLAVPHDKLDEDVAVAVVLRDSHEADEATLHVFAIDIEKRIDGAIAVGGRRTSMRQDLDKGRPMEIDALVTVVQKLGTITGFAAPSIDMILALIQPRARMAGVYDKVAVV